MTRCTNCKVKWKAKDTWSLFNTNEGKDCPYCSNEVMVFIHVYTRLKSVIL
ncbi:hypothetical protein BAMA111019_16385 [Bacillus manliponensis]